MKNIIIAVDGPAGAGKSTIAKIENSLSSFKNILDCANKNY